MQTTQQVHMSCMLTSAIISISTLMQTEWFCSAAQCTAVHPFLMMSVSIHSSARNKIISHKRQTNAPVTYIGVRFLPDQRFDACRLIVFSSKMHCSPSVSPNDTRQHALERVQQALTRRNH